MTDLLTLFSPTPRKPVSTFTPSQLSGLTGWVAARKETGYSDTNLAGTLTNFGSAANLTATGSARPTYRTSQVNSLPAFDFDGTANAVAGSAISNYISASAFTAYVVLNVDAIDTDVSATPYFNDMVWGDETFFIGMELRTTGPTASMYNFDGVNTEVSRTLTTGAWHIVQIRHDSGSMYMLVDNGTETSGTSGSTTTITGNLKIGVSTTYNHFLDGKVAELLLYNVALSSTNRSSVRSYLGSLYGISV